jgi:integrase
VSSNLTLSAKGLESTSRWSDVVEGALDWCLTIGHDIDQADPLFVGLVREFAKVELAAQRGISLRNQGEPVPTPSPVRGHVLSEVIEAFREYKAPSVDAKGLGTVLSMWGDFITHTGDIAFNSVRSSHIYDFLHARMNAPVRSWSEKRAKTFGKSNFREIFGFARTRGLMTEPNPVDSLETLPRHSRKEENSRKKPRYPFLDDHLSRIFASAWYDPDEGSIVRGKLKVDLGARYWIPLFSMAHGNRVREASQLVVSDFRFEDGIYVVAFRVELEDEEPAGDAEAAGQVSRATDIAELRTLKNEATKRTVPVHPLLISLGFIEFVACRRREEGGQALLFPSSAPKPGGKSPKLGRAYEQAFLRFVRDRLKFGSGYGNHSFRHQLEDRMREAQKTAAWPPGLTQQYSGRTSTRAVDKRYVEEEGSEGGYGNGYSPGTLLSYTERLDFSKVTLPIPYAEWLSQAGGNSSVGRTRDLAVLAL